MDIEVMKWPPYGFEPIENLWALLKKAYKVCPDSNSLHGKGDEAETSAVPDFTEGRGEYTGRR
jgi:hypothetical protein